MFNLNRAMIIGNLTRDPELRYTPNGQSVASFAVATNRRWTTADGTQQDDTQYHEIVAWGKLGEIAQQVLHKGKKAYIEGRLQTRSWEAPDGSKRQRTEIIAENIIALSPRDGAGSTDYDSPFPTSSEDFAGSGSAARPAKGTPAGKKGSSKDSGASQSPSNDDEGEIKLEDIPF